jgi:hypothetical protein
MNNTDDDRLTTAASRLATEISPQRDLWPGIEEAIARPKRSRWTPMFAQAAAVVLLVGASSMVTYFVVKEDQRVVEVAGRASLGAEYQQAHGSVASQLDVELQRLSPEARADVERNLAVIRHAITDINQALDEEPDNQLLQELLASAYRDELAVMQRVGSLTQQVMSRQDI